MDQIHWDGVKFITGYKPAASGARASQATRAMRRRLSSRGWSPMKLEDESSSPIASTQDRLVLTSKMERWRDIRKLAWFKVALEIEMATRVKINWTNHTHAMNTKVANAVSNDSSNCIPAGESTKDTRPPHSLDEREVMDVAMLQKQQ
jgi:hypothetical protein